MTTDYIFIITNVLGILLFLNFIYWFVHWLFDIITDIFNNMI